METIKEIKIRETNGSISGPYPIGADAVNIDTADGSNVEEKLRNAATKEELRTVASGSPKGVYETTAALKSANPDTGVYVITSNGHLYGWTKNQTGEPIDLGVYQSTVGIHEKDEDLRNYLSSMYFNEKSNYNVYNSHFMKGWNLNDTTGDFYYDETTPERRMSTPDFMEVFPSTAYKIYNEEFQIAFTGASKRVYFYDKAKNFISSTTFPYGNSSENSFVTTANTYYIRLCIRTAVIDKDIGDAYFLYPNWTIINPQINGYTVNAEYYPGFIMNPNRVNYDWYRIDELERKLARLDNYGNSSSKNILTEAPISYYYIGANSGILIRGEKGYANYATTPTFMKIEPATEYSISNSKSVGKGINKYVYYYDEDFNYISRDLISLSSPFETPDTAVYFRLLLECPKSAYESQGFKNGAEYLKTIEGEWQIEKGSSISNFQSPFLISTDNIDYDFSQEGSSEGPMETDIVEGLKKIIRYNRNGRYANMAYFTDTHSNDHDATKSIKYMKKICDNEIVDMAFHGGDIISTYTPTTVDEYIEEISKTLLKYKSIKNLYFVKGNHDDGHTNTEEGDMTKYQYNVLFHKSPVNNTEEIHFNESDKYGNYYYIDNATLKLRTIVLDSYYKHGGVDAFLGTEQIKWLAETALNTKDLDGWNVVLYSHFGAGTANVLSIGPILKAYNEKETSGTYDYRNDTCKFVGWICGHEHVDKYSNANGYNVIHVSCAFGADACISLFTIDSDQNILYETRIGTGSDRKYTFGDNTAHLITE